MEKLTEAQALIDEAVEAYKLDALFALFSGGHDSLTTTHVASRHPLFRGVIHIDTGTGLKETRQFVEDTCDTHGWPLIVRSPATTYEMLIVRYGFPGAGQHGSMYRYLKERPLREAKKAARKLASAQNIGYITGVRSQESDRRMGHVEPHHKDSEGIWIAAIHNWSALECAAYIRDNGLERSPVKDALHMSGECFCGAFARPSEKRDLALWFPYQAERIEAWQRLVQTAVELGLSSIPFNHQEWGHSDGQPDSQADFLHLCQNCRGD